MVDHKIDVPGLLSSNIKTISRIDDFRRKFLMGYWVVYARIANFLVRNGKENTYSLNVKKLENGKKKCSKITESRVKKEKTHSSTETTQITLSVGSTIGQSGRIIGKLCTIALRTVLNLVNKSKTLKN